jgi:hypothetical protein
MRQPCAPPGLSGPEAEHDSLERAQAPQAPEVVQASGDTQEVALDEDGAEGGLAGGLDGSELWCDGLAVC